MTFLVCDIFIKYLECVFFIDFELEILFEKD